MARRAHQPRRHPGSRRLRRRGGAGPGPGGRDPAARRCRRRPHAPDPLRALESAGPQPARSGGAQQDRPARRPFRRRDRRGLPAVPGPRRRRPPHRVPHRLHRRPGGPRRGRRGHPRGGRRPVPPARRHPGHHSAAQRRPGRPAPGPGHQPGRLRLPGAPRHRPRRPGDTARRPAGRPVPRQRGRAAHQAPAHPTAGLLRAGPDRGGGAPRRRPLRRGRVPRGGDRGHPRRPGRPAAAAPPPGGRAGAPDDLRRQHLSALRPGRHPPHLAPDRGAPRTRGSGQRVDPHRAHHVSRDHRGRRAGASCSWRCSSRRCAARGSSCR